jgi:ubiquinol-cytochrome c reductase cytochrome c subunit
LDEEQIDALVAYGASIGTDVPIPQVVVDAGAPERGRELFVNDCAACHGVTAEGGSVGPGVFAPALVGVDPGVVGEAVVVGPGAMPRFDMETQELSDLAAYLRWLDDAPHPGGMVAIGLGPVPEGLIAVVIGLGLLAAVARWIGSAAGPRP